MGNCNCHSEISFAGSGQLERYLKALDPAYVSIDGRSIEDLLVYAAGYADQIRFYDMPGSPVTDPDPSKVSWAEFFRRDMAVIAASIATVDLNKIKSDYDTTSSQILVDPTIALYKSLFEQIATLVTKIDQWFSVAIPQNPLYADISLAISSSLSVELKKALSYEEGFVVVDSKTVLNIDYSKVLNQQLWGLNDAVEPDFDIYQGTAAGDKIRNAAPYVDDVFHAFYGVISNIVDQAPTYLTYALTQYPGHQPNMALFIAFLELFNVAQQQMNGLTGRMLDFYYRDVLRLAKKPAVPDNVFVIFQLAQNIATYDLPAGTALSAGKDDSGKDQVYKTEGDFVINQANVKELKSIFLDKTYTGTGAISTDTSINAVFADPVANSQDGYGAKFTTASPKWPTFGTGAVSKIDPKNICEYIAQKQAELNSKNTATIGFAIASPQLLLQGGDRLLQVAVDVDETFFKNVTVALTGEKGWLTIDNDSQITNDKGWLDNVLNKGIFDSTLGVNSTSILFQNGVLYIYLPVTEQGIIGFNSKLHIDHTYDTTYPVMQVLIGPDIDLSPDVIKKLTVNKLSLAVQVGSINPAPSTPGATDTGITPKFNGLEKLVIQNDTGIVASGKPFDPFTNLPYYNASFYVGSDEVFNKPLNALAVNIRLTASGTPNTTTDYNSNTNYGVSLLNSRTWVQLVDFNSNQSFSVNTLTYNILKENPDDTNKINIPLDRNPVDYHTGYDLSTDKGFLRLDYLPVASVILLRAESINESNDIQDRLNLAPFLQIKELSVSYKSNLAVLDPQIDQIFHVYPFGTVETRYTTTSISKVKVNTVKKTVSPLAVYAHNSLLPQFTYLDPTSQYQSVNLNNNPNNNLNNGPSVAFAFDRLSQDTDDDAILKKLLAESPMNQLIYDGSGLMEITKGRATQYSGPRQEEGMLYIGVEKLQPLQTLSLLFEFADGSADDEDDAPPTINWSYLEYNKWRPLKAENLVSDSTYGFQTTGIVKISVPEDINDKHTIITDGLYWFSASVTTDSDRIPQLINVIAQATEAQFFDQGNSQTHYDTALPAGSISKLSVAVSQVSKVQQPFASFDGKHTEVGKEYYTRVSERLRHKGRAVTAWDYEHLVLDRFPQVFKVKCIPNINPGCLCPKPPVAAPATAKCCGTVAAPGHVLIVPVPNLKNDNAANPLQPKTARLTLIEIVNYLTPLTSPFVTVHVKNPVYEQVIVFFKVKFLSGVDKGYYLQVLNDDIVKYLTPWAFDPTIEADFDKKIYASSIITFIELRPYVDFITDFLMGICRDDCCPPPDKPAPPAITNTDFVNALNNISGCDDIECFLKDQNFFIGETIAEPSTQMSLLVSAPKHIILLYEDPVVLSPCEIRQQQQGLQKTTVNKTKITEKVEPVAVEPKVITGGPAETKIAATNPPGKSAVEKTSTAETVLENKVEKEKESVEEKTDTTKTTLENKIGEERKAVEERTDTAKIASEDKNKENKSIVEKADTTKKATENKIEEGSQKVIDEVFGGVNKITEKGKAALKKAEDLFKRAVGKSEEHKGLGSGNILPESKQLPPANNNPDQNK